MANELRFDTRVDLSGLNQGMAGGVATVKSGSDQIAAAMKTSQQAAQNLAEAMAAFGAAAQAGNAQAKAAIQEYEAAAEQARARVTELAAAENEEGEALQSSMSKRMAASAELRIFEGNLTGSTRAAGALLSSLPGLGEAMQAAFPVFGAIALGEVLIDVGSKIAKITEEYETMGAVGKATLESLIEMDKRLVDSSGKVLNQVREQRVLDAEMTGPKKGRSDRGAAAGAAFDAAQDNNSLVIAQERVIANQKEIDRLREQAKPILGDTGLGAANAAGGGGREVVNQEQINLATKLIEQHTNEQAANQAEVAQLQQKLAIDKEREALRTKEAAEKTAPTNVDQAQMRGIQSQLLDMERVHELSKRELENFWAQYLGTFKRGSSEYNEVERQFVEARNATAKEMKEALEKALKYESPEGADEAIARVAKQIQSGAQDAQQAGEKWEGYWREVSKGQEIATQSAAAMATARIAVEQTSGGITKWTADQELASVRAQAFKDRIAELNAELTKLQSLYAQLPRDPMTGAVQGGAQVQGQIQGVKNQIATTQGQAQVSALNDTAKQAQDISQPFVTAIGTINSEWLGMQNKLIFGTQNISRAFANMGVSMLESVAGSFEKMLVTAATNELKMVVLHDVANQTKERSDISAAAQADAVSAASAIKQVAHDAAVAAAATWAAVSQIPIVGPVLAPVAAAGAYAGVMALAAFDVGGVIPGSGAVPILGHGGERVLTTDQTKTFDQFVANMTGGNTSNSSSASMHNHFYGSSDDQFRRQMTRNANHTLKTVQRGLRNSGRA